MSQLGKNLLPCTAQQLNTAPSSEDTPNYGVTLLLAVRNTTNPESCNISSRANYQPLASGLPGMITSHERVILP